MKMHNQAISPANDLHRAADGFYASVRLTAKTMHEWSTKTGSVMQPAMREAALLNLFYRATAWIKTVETLNSSLHIQGIVTANRALLEIAVDTLLLHHDTTNDLTERHAFWEESATLKISEGVVGYFNREKRPIPKDCSVYEPFIVANKERINQERTKLGWVDKRTNKPKHPDRWTTCDLGSDALAADNFQTDLLNNKIGKTIITEELGSSLTEIYETKYRNMNLLIHGSGQSSLYKADEAQFHRMSLLYFKACTNLATLITRVVMTDLRFFQVPDVLIQWKNFKMEKLKLEFSGLPVSFQQ